MTRSSAAIPLRLAGQSGAFTALAGHHGQVVSELLTHHSMLVLGVRRNLGWSVALNDLAELEARAQAAG